MRKAWNYLLAEPFAWIFYAFFQPRRLEREFGGQNPWQRFLLMLRMIVPMVLFICLFGVVGQILLILFLLFSYPVATILQITAFGLVFSLIGAIAVGITVGIARGIALGIAFGIVYGIAGDIAGAISISLTVGLVGAIAVGIVGLAVGVGVGVGIARGIAAGLTVSLAFGVIFDIAFGIAFGYMSGIDVGSKVVAYGILSGLAGAIVGSIAFAIAFAIARSIWGSIAGSIAVGVAVGITFGVAVMIGVFVAGDAEESIMLGLTFIGGYYIGLFRLPFYLVSFPSMLKAYGASRSNPSQIFVNLQRSSLHWDEIVYLPLPYLKEMLLIAYDKDAEKTLEEIAFIATERPLHLRAARAALLEIATRNLEKYKTLSEIAQVGRFLDVLFPQETKLLNPQWALPITRLQQASQDAARFGSPLGRRAKLEALRDMIEHLKEARSSVSFGDVQINNRIAKVVDLWIAVAQREQVQLEQFPGLIGRIDNPYNPGNALKPNDPLFFGRLDLVRVLEAELMKGERHSTFLMTGERRMGKSSTLLQLPRLLGSRFIPVFYDLQSPGIFASTPTFLGTLADGIYKEMNARSMPVNRLVYRAFRDFTHPTYQFSTSQALDEIFALTSIARSEESAPVAYNIFDKWLSNVESLLVREDRALLLLLDEFEKLEEAGLKRAFDLPLLFDWFRSILQFHPRIAILFSGVHSFGEMGKETGLNWSGYFVNVQTLRVSFLHKDEAWRLITRPIDGFPSEGIYGYGVVERIIAETGCHPFLVQALCSALIDQLNAEKKGRAELKDVSRAIDRTFNNWWDTYFRDLWIRTDEHQRACLVALRALGAADREQIQRRSGLDEIVTWRTLEVLLKRDLVRKNEDGMYSISTPIFSKWVEHSMYM